MSRGAWTDEGLNTVQVRNFVNHGYLSMDECDNLIKTPYFGFVLVPFYSLLGTHIWVGRLLILACVLVVLFLFLRKQETRLFGSAMAVIGLLQFHVFHYSHYSLAEILAISWVMLGIYLLWISERKNHRLWLIGSTACFSLAYYSKVTFAYVVLIPFAVKYLQFLSDRAQAFRIKRPLWQDWAIQSIVTAFFAVAFYLKWYLPNKVVFEMVKANQGQGRYDIADAWTRFRFNLEEFIMVDGITPFIILLPIALLGLSRIKFSEKKQTIFFGLLAWLVLELHHGLLVNPPTRYLLPLYFACLAIVAFGMSEVASLGLRKSVVWIALLIFGGYNLSHYASAYSRRTFQIDKVRKYLSSYELNDKTILGVWGTTLASGSNARSVPVWSDFNAKSNPISEYKPRVIFSEHNEAESGEAYLSQGIDLKIEADSVLQFDLWRYKVNLYWMKQ